MNISSVTSSTGTASQSPAAKVDYQTFLKLLVAEMKNQDPTNPMKSSEYVAQLATFSQVEQSIQTNSKLDQLLQGSLLSQAESIIGRTITSYDGTVSGTVASVRVFSDGIVAILDGGTEVVIEPGVKIS